MEVIGILASIALVLVIPIALIAGMIRPSWVKMASRGKVFGVCASLAILCLAIIIWVANSTKAGDHTEPQPAASEHYDDYDLAWFIKQDMETRQRATAHFMTSANITDKELDGFYTCLADFASSKDGSLKISAVFGWCKNEFAGKKKAFDDHFNELDAPDYSLSAHKQCQHAIESQLVSPSTADFPWSADRTFYRGRLRYVFKMHVDSQNAFGAMIRSNWHCDIQYTGSGGQFDSGSWTLHGLEQQG